VGSVARNLDVETLRRAFLDGLSVGSGAEWMMGQVWRDAGLIDVERRAPLTTGSGKVLHLHVQTPPT
jgi:hypothetical protein